MRIDASDIGSGHRNDMGYCVPAINILNRYLIADAWNKISMKQFLHANECLTHK